MNSAGVLGFSFAEPVSYDGDGFFQNFDQNFFSLPGEGISI